jgi:hypothetical protein
MGKIEHVDGGHDDTVIAKAFCKYCMIHHYNTMKRFLNGADLGDDHKGRKLLNVSAFNRRGFMEKENYQGQMGSINKQDEVVDTDAAMRSKLHGVIQLNHLEKNDSIEIYNEGRPKTINPEDYFDKYDKQKKKKKKYLIL